MHFLEGCSRELKGAYGAGSSMQEVQESDLAPGSKLRVLHGRSCEERLENRLRILQRLQDPPGKRTQISKPPAGNYGCFLPERHMEEGWRVTNSLTETFPVLAVKVLHSRKLLCPGSPKRVGHPN